MYLKAMGLPMLSTVILRCNCFSWWASSLSPGWRTVMPSLSHRQKKGYHPFFTNFNPSYSSGWILPFALIKMNWGFKKTDQAGRSKGGIEFTEVYQPTYLNSIVLASFSKKLHGSCLPDIYTYIFTILDHMTHWVSTCRCSVAAVFSSFFPFSQIKPFWWWTT